MIYLVIFHTAIKFEQYKSRVFGFRTALWYMVFMIFFYLLINARIKTKFGIRHFICLFK